MTAYAATGNPTNLRHCTIDGCRRPFWARELCKPHYEAWRRYGTPVRPRKPRLRLPASWKVPRP
jgi:hypothetical protein